MISANLQSCMQAAMGMRPMQDGIRQGNDRAVTDRRRTKKFNGLCPSGCYVYQV